MFLDRVPSSEYSKSSASSPLYLTVMEPDIAEWCDIPDDLSMLPPSSPEDSTSDLPSDLADIPFGTLLSPAIGIDFTDHSTSPLYDDVDSDDDFDCCPDSPFCVVPRCFDPSPTTDTTTWSTYDLPLDMCNRRKNSTTDQKLDWTNYPQKPTDMCGLVDFDERLKEFYFTTTRSNDTFDSTNFVKSNDTLQQGDSIPREVSPTRRLDKSNNDIFNDSTNFVNYFSRMTNQDIAGNNEVPIVHPDLITRTAPSSEYFRVHEELLKQEYDTSDIGDDFSEVSYSPESSSRVPDIHDKNRSSSTKSTLVCQWVDCRLEFPSQSSLVRHIEKCHVDQRKREDFSCLWVGCPRKLRPFNARYKLLIHMRVHSGEKPNKCMFVGCEKAFSRLENLKIHFRSHTGERPYQCQFIGCPKAFSNSSDRAKHQRTHQDSKPYYCQEPGCNKRYTDPSSLRKHVKNHALRLEHLNKRAKSSKSSSSVETFYTDYNDQNEFIQRTISENSFTDNDTSGNFSSDNEDAYILSWTNKTFIEDNKWNEYLVQDDDAAASSQTFQDCYILDP